MTRAQIAEQLKQRQRELTKEALAQLKKAATKGEKRND